MLHARQSCQPGCAQPLDFCKFSISGGFLLTGAKKVAEIFSQVFLISSSRLYKKKGLENYMVYALVFTQRLVSAVQLYIYRFLMLIESRESLVASKRENSQKT